MPSILPLTETAISDYWRHVDQYPDSDQAILDYLTRHINGLMCAEIERVVTRLIRERLRIGCRDEATANYLTTLRRSAVRNATLAAIKGTLDLFGSEYGSKFGELVHQSVGDPGISKLGMAVENRNQDAHDNPPDITFRELEEAYTVAVQVVEAVRQVLET